MSSRKYAIFAALFIALLRPVLLALTESGYHTRFPFIFFLSREAQVKDWLKKRLTPKKQQEDRWTSLAESIQNQWEDEFDPSLKRLEDLRSYFRAHDDDLAKKLREMGDYFAADMPRTEDKPIAVAWRRLELEYKDLELILSSVFRRHYADLPVTWFPLFAPIDEIYGSQFEPAQGPWPERKNVPPDGWFLTSRGLLGTDFGHLLSIGLSKQEYIDKAMPLLLRTKPLHIVLDGLLWYIRFDIPFDVFMFPETVWWERECGIYELQFSVLGSRFDYTAADVRDLDIQSALCTWDRTNFCDVPFIPMGGRVWHLDFYLPEDLSKDWLPVDTIIAGWENIKSPFTLVAEICDECFPFSPHNFAVKSAQIKDESAKAYFAPAKTDVTANTQSRIVIPYETGWSLDKGISNVPDGWLIDPIIPGSEASLIPILSFIDNWMPFSASMQRLEAFTSRDKPAIYSIGFEAQTDALMEVTEPAFLMEADFDDMGRLDRYPRFDDFPADKLPLDMPIGGAYA